jgi:hypothetical protein
MSFQLFGYRFEMRSPLSPDVVRAAIRSRTSSWFDPKDSARGWIVGPVIGLQWGISRSAPVLYGRIVQDGSGTRISGRAGYVGGGIAILVLVPGAVFMFFLLLINNALSFGGVALLAGLTAIILLFLRADPHDADPLVRFLRSVIEEPSKSPKAKPVVLPPADSFPKTLRLEESGSKMDGPVTPEMVKESLQAIDEDGFVILSLAEERYVQTVHDSDGYTVEKRDGDDDHHYRAARRGSPDKKDVFAFEETLTIFLAYGAGAPMPSFLEWKKIRV